MGTEEILGFCTLCDKLVNIVPKGKRNDKQEKWYPVMHDHDNQLCLGHKVEVK